MKIRSGFVSNSSSASYVIDKKAYKNTFSLARKMIERRDGKGWDNEDLIATLDSFEAGGYENDIQITFPTCNFDTFIMRTNRFYAVSTCNNHDFEGLFYTSFHVDFSSDPHVQAAYALIEADDHHCTQEFWMPKLNLMISPLPYEELFALPSGKSFCKQHHGTRPMKIIGTEHKMCPYCFAEKFKDNMADVEWGIPLKKNPIIIENNMENRFGIMDFD